MSAPKNEENAPGGESGNKTRKRRKDKLIRLDDLIPKQDVKGGRQLLFGSQHFIRSHDRAKINAVLI